MKNRAKSNTHRILPALVAALAISIAPAAALASGGHGHGGGSGGPLNILVTNDDGFETENIQALYDALVAAGHNVILSAPYLGQSGKSGAIDFLQPIFPASEPSEGGTLPPGSWGTGPTTLGPQQFYVNGPPTSAVFFGIDIASEQIFGGPPDLVLSGPNEGHNTGLITPHSGTVGATVSALNLGIPAIAISASRDDATAAEAELIAAITLEIVDSVNGAHGIKLPPSTGLNVNIPDVDPATQTVDDFDFAHTRIGVATEVGPQFYEQIGTSPIAIAFGIPPGLPYPGLSLEIPYTTAGYPEDTASHSEGNALGGTTVTVSVIEGTYQASFHRNLAVGIRLRDLFR